MKSLLLATVIFGITSCSTPTYNPAVPLEPDQGIVIFKIYVTGDIPAVQVIPNLSLFSFVTRTSHKIFVTPMSAGIHYLSEAIYGQGSQLISIDLSCLGYFEIYPGKISYIGDLHLDIGKEDDLLIYTSHPYRFGLKDNMENTTYEAFQEFRELKDKYPVLNSFISPNACVNSRYN